MNYNPCAAIAIFTDIVDNMYPIEKVLVYNHDEINTPYKELLISINGKRMSRVGNEFMIGNICYIVRGKGDDDTYYIGEALNEAVEIYNNLKYS